MLIKIKRVNFGSAVLIDNTTSMSATVGRNCDSIIYDTEEQIYYINGSVAMPPNQEKMQHIVHATNVQYSLPVEKKVPEAQVVLPTQVTINAESITGLPKKK